MLTMQDGKNLFQGWQGGKGGMADHFLAGILAHLPALQALTVPTPIGYFRMQPGTAFAADTVSMLVSDASCTTPPPVVDS